MKGAWIAAAAVAGLTGLGGCQTWHDRADARALEACEKIADADERRRCQETVTEVERAKQQKAMEDLQLRIDESEERERLNEVFGDPKKP